VRKKNSNGSGDPDRRRTDPGGPGTLSLFSWLVADGWCWFVLREEYCWLVTGGWFVLREKYGYLVAGKPSEQAFYCHDDA
jgi:hypothetical protein